MTAFVRIAEALRSAGLRVAETSTGARSQCPAHGSKGLTLAIRPNQKNPDGPVQLTCFAGCAAGDVLAELGLTLGDLYDDNTPRPRTPARPKPSPWDLLGDPGHFCDRIQQQEAIEASPEHRQHLRDLAAWAAPRPGDYAGGPSGDWGQG